MFFIKALAVWMIMVFAAIANGLFRENILNPHVGETIALPISGLFLSVLVFGISYKSLDYFVSYSIGAYILLGVIWTILTLLFEYGFGHFVRGLPFSEINEIFKLKKGNLFILVILVTLISPVVGACLKGYIDITTQ